MHLVRRLRGVRRPPRLVKNLIGLALFLLAVTLIILALLPGRAADVVVSFNHPVGQVNPYAFSGDISTYGQDGGSVGEGTELGAKQRRTLAALGPGLWRVPLKLVNGRWVSAADYVSGDIPGDQWIQAIEVFGTPQIDIQGAKADNDFTPAEGAAAVRHFRILGPRGVQYYVLGNEPDSAHMSMADYCQRFVAAAKAMKAIDFEAKIAGPGLSKFDEGQLIEFLDCVAKPENGSGKYLDILDFHHYGQGQGNLLTNAAALSQTAQYGLDVLIARKLIDQTMPWRANQVQVQVGELNWSWTTQDGFKGWPDKQNDDRFYQAVTTVWGASVIGHIMAAGGIAHPYADQNGALGLTFEKAKDAEHFHHQVDDPMPLYWGELMFTGSAFSGSFFRHFGTTLVQSTSKLAGVEAYASDHPRNVVLVNKSPDAQSVKVALRGQATGMATVWQTDPTRPFAPPTRKGQIHIQDQQVTVSLPGYSVTTLIIKLGAAPAAAPHARTGLGFVRASFVLGAASDKMGANALPSQRCG